MFTVLYYSHIKHRLPMNIREEIEAAEMKNLSEFAAKSCLSEGRETPIAPCEFRTCYQRDRDRIIHSKSFRRLKHKTQVFLSPTGDHYRTRLTHTLEVSQIARTIARALRLNEDLTEAIALGHDLGHTPFGHAGERALNAKYKFKHNIQSLRVVEILEKDGKGLNLCREVRDGILNHGMNSIAKTLEGRVVRLSDKIAYINHDMDDAFRAGILKEEDIPIHLRRELGASRHDRLDFLINNIIINSVDRDDIVMDSGAYCALMDLRSFMFESVYSNPECKGEEVKAISMLKDLYDYYLDHINEMPEEYIRLIDERGTKPQRAVCDYISGMTDHYSVEIFNKLFVPEFWRK